MWYGVVLWGGIVKKRKKRQTNTKGERVVVSHEGSETLGPKERLILTTERGTKDKLNNILILIFFMSMNHPHIWHYH